MEDQFSHSEEEKILLKRAGSEEDVSNLALFLSSDKASYINNQIIKINGGMYGD
jgi:3-oxoacyl-[acyl-carrier protein] reductase